MDANVIGSIVTTFIHSCYPGGSVKFSDDGGMVAHLPGDDEYHVVLFVPDMPDVFKEAIDIFNNKGVVRIKVVTEVNFKDCSPNEAFGRINSVVHSLSKEYDIPLLVNPTNPLLLTVLIPSDIEDVEVLEDIKDRLIHIDGLLRACLIVNGEAHLIQGEVVNDTPKISLEPDRRKITDEDITDLRIILSGDVDVNDIINSL